MKQQNRLEKATKWIRPPIRSTSNQFPIFVFVEINKLTNQSREPNINVNYVEPKRELDLELESMTPESIYLCHYNT